VHLSSSSLSLLSSSSSSSSTSSRLAGDTAMGGRGEPLIRCTPHGAALEPDACTHEKFATETIAARTTAPRVYARHDRHELCSGADRRRRGGGKGPAKDTRGPRPRLKYNLSSPTRRPRMRTVGRDGRGGGGGGGGRWWRNLYRRIPARCG